MFVTLMHKNMFRTKLVPLIYLYTNFYRYKLNGPSIIAIKLKYEVINTKSRHTVNYIKTIGFTQFSEICYDINCQSSILNGASVAQIISRLSNCYYWWKRIKEH